MGNSINFEKNGNNFFVSKFDNCIGIIKIENGCYIDKKWIKGAQYVFDSYQTSEYLYLSELEEILNKVKELNKR